MQLKKLEIRMLEWGENEGKYTGTLVYKDDRKTDSEFGENSIVFGPVQ
jgi:hypothetical protein